MLEVLMVHLVNNVQVGVIKYNLKLVKTSFFLIGNFNMNSNFMKLNDEPYIEDEPEPFQVNWQFQLKKSENFPLFQSLVMYF